jgi:pimeloyl-ACP methyl ester carboxylesterase
VTAIEQSRVAANGLTFHVRRAGSGPPLVLLHGWPEFSLTWELVMRRLADRFSVIAPDFRGFGDSDKPDAGPTDRAGPDVHAADILALLDALGLAQVGLVAHDVGGNVAQSLCRTAPERFSGLFLFDTPYPGIGTRWGAPGQLKEIWYQSFHQLPWAAPLVGASRDTCRAYIGHFLRHWSARPDAFDDVLEAWVDNFLKPGNLQGGFNYYISVNAARLATMRGETPALPPIAVPTCVRWGAGDPVLRVEWADRLGETFTHLDFAPFEGVGHFPHREAPDQAAAMIATFFERAVRT